MLKSCSRRVICSSANYSSPVPTVRESHWRSITCSRRLIWRRWDITTLHWSIHPVYTYFGERKNKNSFGREDNLLSLSYGRVIRKDINTSDGLLPESFNTYNIVEAGDIIIRPTDLQNDKRSLRTGLVKEHGIITSAYIDLCPLKQVDSRYFHFLLHAYDVMKVFYNMGNGVRQGLNYSEFSRLMVFEPPYEEQVAMADYLETKGTEVDAIIEQKKEWSDPKKLDK